MNAERLHAIAIALHQEMNSSGIAAKVEQLCAALQTVVNQPHPNHQENLANRMKAVYSTLDAAPSDTFSPALRQSLSEMGGTQLFGKSLKAIIEEIFQRNQITPAVALRELQEIRKQLESFQTALHHLISAFSQFKIGDEKLEPGQCEIGMLIPREAVDNKLGAFADELEELSFILNTFSEVATGKPDDLCINTISSSDLTVYLNAGSTFAACLAVAIERIVALYKQLLEVKKLRVDLLKQGVPEQQTAGIEDYANALMDKGIKENSVEIVERFYRTSDGGRKHELVTAVNVSMRRIAERVDRGYNIEVRVEPLTTEAQDSQPDKGTSAIIQIIQDASKNMQFIKQGGAPILRLSEGKEKAKAKKEKEK
jgi:hypothetical protein